MMRPKKIQVRLLFVYDPNGIQLKLTFHAAAEHEAQPVVSAARLYKPRERWFQPELYRQFARF